MSKNRRHKPKYNRRKIRFVSYDNPQVKKQLDRKIYQDYLRDMYTDDEGGTNNG